MSEQVVVHRLSGKDLATNTGTCSVCGLVALARSGRGFQCAKKKAAGKRDWALRNPEKAKANRARKSDHELFDRAYVSLDAKCTVCGPVKMVPYGRGYACGNRAAELRTQQETTPRGHCRECQIIDGDRVWLRADGSCPRCSDPDLCDTAAMLKRGEWRSDSVAHEYESAGYSVRYSDDYTDDREPAVRGWRTIGSDRPWNEV